MREIKSILSLFDSGSLSEEKAAIAQVVRVEESSYRREGARMIVFESGVFEGGISGGCLEGDALKRSQMAILKGSPSVVTYDTSKEKEIGVGLGCNGLIEVLITPINENPSAIEMLRKCVADRRHHCIATITGLKGVYESLEVGNSFYYNADAGKIESCEHAGFERFASAQAANVLEKQKSNTCDFLEGEQEIRVFIEYVPPQYHLAVYGDNYDVYPILELAEVMDWEVSLVGNIQKLDKKKLRSVKALYPKDMEARPKIDDRTAILLMAHDFKTDIANLEFLIKTAASYIGSLGPKKRFVKMENALKERGVLLSDADLNRIYAPCGLEIGANTPEEIAASIFSEILSVFSGNTGGMLRYKQGPIHERG